VTREPLDLVGRPAKPGHGTTALLQPGTAGAHEAADTSPMTSRQPTRLHRALHRLPRPWRWILITVAGTTVTLLGIILLPLPGPGSLVILVGLTILAVEFEWARHLAGHGHSLIDKLLTAAKHTLNRWRR
jgi:uncharacterized protein (TIGR02611 family)